MLPLSIFRNARFNVANTVGFCIYGSLCGAVFLTSQYFQIAQHHSPIAGRPAVRPVATADDRRRPAGRFAGREVRQPAIHGRRHDDPGGRAGLVRHRRPRRHPLLESVPAAGAQRHRHRLVFPTFSGEVVASVRPDQMGIAAGANATIRELGGVFGVALAGLVFAGPAVYAASEAFVTGFVHAIWTSVALSAVGAVVAAGGLHIPATTATDNSATETPALARPLRLGAE